MVQVDKILKIEYTAILLLWIVVIISPRFFMADFNQNWMAVHIMWSECIVVGFAFLINRFVLMPQLFFTKRYVAYITSIVGLLLLLSIFILYFDGVSLMTSLFSADNQAMTPPHDMAMPPIDMPPHGGLSPRSMPRIDMPPLTQVIPPAISILVVSVIVIALDLGLRIAVTWIITEQKQAAINRERIMVQLQNLQSQVSPHFFMNTLNNIHALVDIDSQRAKHTIIELSDLMSYLLYDCSNRDNILLQKELDFITNYINLMRLRFSTQVKINFSYGDDIPSVKIPPLLFLNFIENAFKYGIDYDKESIIKIDFSFTESSITMKTLNSNHASTVKDQRHGMGITNSRNRLDLLYGDNYSLHINDTEKIYFVTLKIPIQ